MVRTGGTRAEHSWMIAVRDRRDEPNEVGLVCPRRAFLAYLAFHAARSIHGDFPKGGSYTSNGTCALVGWRRFL